MRRRNFLKALPVVGALGTAAAKSNTQLHINGQSKTVDVMQGERLVRRFAQAAFGRRGVQHKYWRGDDVTPQGTYHITHRNTRSKFHLFIGLSYPNIDDAARALSEGWIDQVANERIAQAWRLGQNPPQDTPLGGYIGLHGVGAGSLAIHQQYDWTKGCIALTNRQIDALNTYLYIGMRVQIKA